MSLFLEGLAFVAGMGLSMLPIYGDSTGINQDILDTTTYVRIGAGVFFKGENPTTPGRGSRPGLALFDINGDMIGNVGRGGPMSSTSLVTIESNSEVAISIPEYLSVSSGDDAICIAYIYVTSADSLQQTWTGDVARACHLPYYISHYNIGSTAKPNYPMCLWLKGRSNFAQDGALFKGMGIHLPDFTAKGTDSITASFYNRNIEKLCNNPPRFWMYDELTPDDMMPYFSPPIDEIAYFQQPDNKNPDPWSKKPPVDVVPEDPPVTLYKSRRDIPEKDKVNAMKMNGTLIITPVPQHHAEELCEDKYFMGPDFVSLSDSMYCDMHNRKVYPLCVGHGKDKQACFDFNSTTLHAGSGGHPHRRDVVLPEKSYHNVVNW